MDPAERLRPYVAGLSVAWADTMPDVRHRAVEGSLSFVDISGFTTLTERLAAKGKVGAEEMSDLLSASFSTLLEVAYGYGASLVKWGGDAVLLLYEDADHAALACRSAFEMQRTMRRIGRLRTSVGVVQLRMSVGISSGAFDFFFVGDRHRELLVAGPAATETAAMEQIAEAGEVVISPATAALLPSRCVGEAKEAGRLLRAAPAADPRSRWWPPARSTDSIAGCLDPALRQHLLTEVGESEHRQAAVGFVEVSGVDALLSRQGPGATAAALHELVTVVQEAGAHHRVTFWETDISKDGFKILLIAGAPRSSGHDEDAMLRAARAILDGYAGPVHLRIGLNTGRVFNGGFGPSFRRTWSVKGDAVNLAARVMGKAADGQLLATEALLRRVGSQVQAELLPPFMVKGKKQVVHAAVVHRISAERALDSAAASAFVGRRSEMDLMLDAVRRLDAGQGSSVLITGPPGVGKSRLVDHVVSRVGEQTAVLRGFAEDDESTTPYYAVRRLLRAAIAMPPDARDADVATELRRRVVARAPELEPWLPLIAVPFDVEVPETPDSAAVLEEFRRPRTTAVVAELLSAVVTSPTVFVVDDVHVADELSVELLARLATDSPQHPWLVVLVGRARPEGLPDDGVRELAVPALRSEDARALLLDVPGAESLAPHVIRAVLDRAEGNPLFLRELAAAAGSGDDAELPGTLEELFAARIDDLAPDVRRLLRTVSVLGTRFDESLAGELFDAPPTPEQWSSVDRFLARHADGSRRFRTGLAREAAYEGLPFRRRQELHGRAAAALERRAGDDGDDRAEALSLHCLAARRYGDAWRYATLAADRARRVYANAESLVFARRAWSALPHLDDASTAQVAELCESIGVVCERLGLFSEGMAAMRQGRKATSDPVLRGRLAVALGRSAYAAGAVTSALRWLTAAVRELEAADGSRGTQASELIGRAKVERAHIQYKNRRPREAARLCGQAVAVAEPVGAAEVVGRALLLLDAIEFWQGASGDDERAMQAVQLFERCEDLPSQANAWNWLGTRAYFAGRWDLALERYERTRAIDERCGNEWSAAIASGNIGEILVDQGRMAEAEPLLAEALRVWRATQAPSSVGFGASLLGCVRARTGRRQQAMELFDEAIAAYTSTGEVFDLVQTRLRIAEAHLLTGDTDAAISHLDDAETGLTTALRAAGIPSGAGDPAALSGPEAAMRPAMLRLRAVADEQSGKHAQAVANLRQSLHVAREHDAAHSIAVALHLLSWADDASAAEHREAASVLAQLGVVWLPDLPRSSAAPSTVDVSDARVQVPRPRAGDQVRA